MKILNIKLTIKVCYSIRGKEYDEEDTLITSVYLIREKY